MDEKEDETLTKLKEENRFQILVIDRFTRDIKITAEFSEEETLERLSKKIREALVPKEKFKGNNSE